MLTSGGDDESSKELWVKDMCQRSATFKYWDLIIKYETLILMFVRAHRERNFPLWIATLEQLTPLFFALDHINYARWVPVHIRDMQSLPESVKQKFEQDG